MKIYPESALVQLEFDKIQQLLAGYYKTEYAKGKAAALRVHTKQEYIRTALQQSYEYLGV